MGVDAEVPIEMRDGVLVLTDRGKLVFLIGKEGKKKKTTELDGCKVKWSVDINKLVMADAKVAEPGILSRIGDRESVQQEVERLEEIEKLVNGLRHSDAHVLKSELTLLKERQTEKLALIGPAQQMTVRFSSEQFPAKFVRFSNGVLGRGWIDLIRGQKIVLQTESTGWKVPNEDNSTTGAERVLPTYIGSICTMPEAAVDSDFARKPDNGEFYFLSLLVNHL